MAAYFHREVRCDALPAQVVAGPSARRRHYLTCLRAIPTESLLLAWPHRWQHRLWLPMPPWQRRGGLPCAAAMQPMLLRQPCAPSKAAHAHCTPQPLHVVALAHTTQLHRQSTKAYSPSRYLGLPFVTTAFPIRWARLARPVHNRVPPYWPLV